MDVYYSLFSSLGKTTDNCALHTPSVVASAIYYSIFKRCA